MSTSTVETTSQVQVGDFFVSSWGYDQTNVDFYKVVGITPSGKSVKVQKWQGSAVSDGVHDKVSPGGKPDTWVDWSGVDQDADYWDQQEQKVTRDAPIETKRIKVYGSTVAFAVNSYSSASKWDGRPQYQTGQGYGH